MEITEDFLVDWYRKFNRMFFFSKLPMPNRIKFIISEDENAEYLGYSKINSRKGYKEAKEFSDDIFYCICMVAPLLKTEKDVLSVLCHEMIHIWQWEEIDFEKYSSDYSWLNSHNGSFVSKMNNINFVAKEDYGIDIEIKLFG